MATTWRNKREASLSHEEAKPLMQPQLLRDATEGQMSQNIEKAVNLI